MARKPKSAGVSIHIETNECDKILRVRRESQTIGEFLEWLQGPRELTICESGRHHSFYPAHISIQNLLAEYFEIDQNQAEKERRAILTAIQAANEVRS